MRTRAFLRNAHLHNYAILALLPSDQSPFRKNAGARDRKFCVLGTGNVGTVKVGEDPYGAALTPDGRFVYSGNLKGNSLSVIDTATATVVATVTGLDQPRQAISFSKDGKRAFVLNRDLSIAVIDRSSNAVTSTLRGGQ